MSKVFYPSARAALNIKLNDGKGTPAVDIPNTVIWTTPKAVTIHRNRPDQADSFELTFDERDCPFDPSLILSGEASIYLYNEPGLLEKDRLFDRSETIEHKTDGTRQDQLELRRSRFTLEAEPTIVGLFDEVTRELGNDGRWITIQGQDYTAFLLSKQWPPIGDRPRRIPTGKRLDRTIGDMLDDIDPGETLRLVVKNIQPKDLPIVQNSGINGGRRGIPVETDTKYWDVMSKTARRSGFKLYVDGLDVVLEAPESNLEKRASKTIHLAWGENIEHLRVSKKLGIEKLPAIVVVGYDPKKRKRIEVTFPEKFEKVTYSEIKKKSERKPKPEQKTTVKNKSASFSHSPNMANEGEYMIIQTSITDTAALKRYAQSRYEDIGRAERCISLSTRDLTDIDGRNILDVKSGDAVSLTFDDYNREMLSSSRLSEAEKYQAMIDRGFSADAAGEIVANYARLESFKRPLFVREISFTYDSDTGINVEMELVDFVVLKDSLRDKELKNDDGSRLGAPSQKHEAGVLKAAG